MKSLIYRAILDHQKYYSKMYLNRLWILITLGKLLDLCNNNSTALFNKYIY